jgi:hypothetical protein
LLLLITKRLMQETAAGEKLALGADKAADYLLRETRGLIPIDNPVCKRMKKLTAGF